MDTPDFLKHDISLTSLLNEYIKYGIDKRLGIITNCSNQHELLTSELDNRNIKYILSDSPDVFNPMQDFYTIDFRQINLVY